MLFIQFVFIKPSRYQVIQIKFQTTLLFLQLKFSDQECVTDAYPPKERYDCNGYYVSSLVKLISGSVTFMNNFFFYIVKCNWTGNEQLREMHGCAHQYQISLVFIGVIFALDFVSMELVWWWCTVKLVLSMRFPGLESSSVSALLSLTGDNDCYLGNS